MVEGARGCSEAPIGYSRLAPSWPRSTEPGGGGFALDAATGAERWDLLPAILARATAPSVLPDGVAWTQGGVPDWAISFGSGRFAATDVSGATRWQVRRLASCIGNAAGDAATGDLLVAIGAEDYGAISTRRRARSRQASNPTRSTTRPSRRPASCAMASSRATSQGCQSTSTRARRRHGR